VLHAASSTTAGSKVKVRMIDSSSVAPRVRALSQHT